MTDDELLTNIAIAQRELERNANAQRLAQIVLTYSVATAIVVALYFVYVWSLA